MSDFMKVETIPLSDRMLSAASLLYGQMFAGLAMSLVAPFSALKALATKEKTVLDYSKLPVVVEGGGAMQHMGAMPMGSMELGPMMGPGDSAGDMSSRIMDMFDTREPWKKAHDEEYGEDNGR